MIAFTRQVASLLVCGCIIFATSLCGQIFTGHDATEAQLTRFVASIKELQPGRGTADDVLNAIGAPHAKLREDGLDVWRYSFLVSPDDEAIRLEQQISQLRKERSSLYHQSTVSFAEDDRIDAAIDRIEGILESLVARRSMVHQQQMLQVDCDIAMDSTGLISNIQVGKSSSQGRETIYSRGESRDIGVTPDNPIDQAAEQTQKSQASDVPPDSPSPGEIYFNTRDKAFYGWDGSKWVPLNGGSVQ